MSERLIAKPPREPVLDGITTLAIRGSNQLANVPPSKPLSPLPIPQAVDRRAILTNAQLPVIEGYEIVRQLGRGGMGVVYLARDVALNRWVALKVVVGGVFAGVEAIERFRREAEAVAALQHPNIVQIFHVGTSAAGMDNGPACPFIALEYADGGTLAAHTGKPMVPRVAAEIVATLADAVQYAHSRGIVHRDLKPGNVLMRVNPHPTSSADGLLNRLTPKVTDFGLAKRVDANGDSFHAESATVAGSMLGTPEYMAPEQAQGDGDIGPAADIYALGVILYELLTARVPLQGADALDTLMRVRTQEPALPSRLQARLPRDLDTICSRCLQKDPGRRYSSAATLAGDLRAWLDGHPITARPIGNYERLCKWARRSPAVAALMAAVLVVATAGFVGVFWQWQRAEARALAERHALEQASVALDRAETNLYFGRVNIAQRELAAGNPWDAVRILDACRPKEHEPDRRGWEWRYLKKASRGELLSFQVANDWVWDIAYSLDGTMLVTASGSPYEGERDKPGTLVLWDALTGQRIRSFVGHKGTVRRAGFSPDGRYLCSASFDKTMRIWNVATGEAVGPPHACMLNSGHMHDSYGSAGPCWFAPDSSAVEFQGPEQWQRVDVATGQITPLPRMKDALTRSPDGRYGLFVRSDGAFEVIEQASGETCGWVQHPKHGDRGALGADGKFMVLSNGEHLELFDAETGQRQRVYESGDSWIEVVACSGDGRHVAAAGSGRTISVWNDRHWFPVSYVGHAAEVRALSFSPDGQRLASCDRAGQVFIWDLSRNPRQQLIQTGTDAASLSAIGLSADGDCVMSVSAWQDLQRFDRRGHKLPTLKLEGLTKKVEYPRLDVTFSPDGRYVVGPMDDDKNVVRQWDTATGAIVREYRGHQYQVAGTAWSRDGQRLAIRTVKREQQKLLSEVWVWDAITGEKLHEVTTEPIVGMALSSDGCKLGGGNRLGEIFLWDVATGRELWRGVAHRPSDFDGRPTVRLFAVAFSPNDHVLATGGFTDGSVQLWKSATGEKFNEPLLGRATLTGVAFTQDGQRIASIGYDGEVRMWDVATGQFALALTVPTGARRADMAYTARPVFSLNNHRLAALNWNSYIAVWDGSDTDDNAGRPVNDHKPLAY